ncbi:hypothetical protein [Leptothoe kymatousa]|nr:hypothetical protein [Leptothoe kymatousa]
MVAGVNLLVVKGNSIQSGTFSQRLNSPMAALAGYSLHGAAP